MVVLVKIFKQETIFKSGNFMKMINNIQRIILSIVLLTLTLSNVEVAAGFFKAIGISATTAATLPNLAIKVAYTTPIGNEISAVQLQINDTTANGQFVKQYQGKELEQLVAEAKKSYPGQSLDNAISLRLQDSLYHADHGNPKPLITLLDPNRHDRLEHEFQLKDLEFQLKSNSSSQQKTELKLQPSENIPAESAELRHKAETDLARTKFEQSAIRDNASELTRLSTQKKYREQLRNDYSSFKERVGGIHRLNQKTFAFFESPSIKKLFDLYNYKIFDGNLNTRAKQAVEAQWSCLKVALFNQYISVNNNGKIEHYEPSDRTKELFAYYIAELSNECAPEVFGTFYNRMMQVPEFIPTLEYIESKNGNFFEWLGNKIVYHANNTTDNALKWLKTNTISWSPTFEQEKHFKHLGTIDTLCREGNFEQARALANPNVATEQELIAEHAKLADVVTPQQQPIPTTPTQQVITPEQKPLIDSMSIAIAQESLNSNFPVSPYTVSVLRDYYVQDVKEITDFAPTNFQQLVVHDHLVATINKQSTIVFTSPNVAEQAIALHVTDGLLQACELNAQDKLHLLETLICNMAEEHDQAINELKTAFLARLTHSIQHPIERIKETVVGTLDLAKFIANMYAGELFMTPQQQIEYCDQLMTLVTNVGTQLGKATGKDIRKAVGHITADMFFGKGIEYLSKKAIKELPTTLAKVAESIQDTTKAEKQVVATTAEGFEIALKTEAEQITKQATHALESKPKNPDYAHSLSQYEELKNALKSEIEVGSIQRDFTKIPIEKTLVQASSQEEMLKKLQQFEFLPHKIIKTVSEATSHYKDFEIFIDPDKNYIVAMTKPGNLPGRRAIYYYKITPTGKTLQMFKDSFYNGDKFDHRKYKIY